MVSIDKKIVKNRIGITAETEAVFVPKGNWLFSYTLKTRFKGGPA
jgi:hypothetical protein